MYNFNLEDNESVVIVLDNVLIKQGERSKETSVAVTNKRLLFLDNFNQVGEDLRVSRGVSYNEEKDVYFSILLSDIVSINNNEIVLNDNFIVVDNMDIINSLKELTK